ncbi:unnamed protein product [Soboliphyme baturini]|uniref:Uncharacterized protein n=1 Tax=Soboliphyme baturini TaxID=241478 RepID=A0A183IL30_9BILA|nr:unnamed protein product [Soboliphyme baturini]
MRLFLRIRQRLKHCQNDQLVPGECLVKTPVSPCEPKCIVPEHVELTDREKAIAYKTLALIKQRIPVNKEPPTGSKANETVDEGITSMTESTTSTAILDGSSVKKVSNAFASIGSPSVEFLSKIKSRSIDDLRILCVSNEAEGIKKSLSYGKLHSVGLYIPEVLEQRIGTTISKKGFMNFLEEKNRGWIKRWAVSIMLF